MEMLSTAATTDCRPKPRNGRQVRQIEWKGLARSTAALYVIQCATYLVPIVLLPYLSRALGPEAFGVYALCQTFAMYGAILVDYGFLFSGSRAIARAGVDVVARSAVVRDVLSGKLVMVGALGLITGALTLAPFPLAAEPLLLWLSLLWGCGSGLSLTWYFFGLEALPKIAPIEGCTRVVAATLTLVYVKDRHDVVYVVVIQTACTLCSTGAGYLLARRQILYQKPSIPRGWAALAEGWGVFTARSASSLHGVMNVMVLGTVAPAAEVGYFAAAEKLYRAPVFLLSPITQTIYPRIARLYEADRPRSRVLFGLVLGVMLVLGVAAGGAIYILSETAARLVLGATMARAAVPLKVLALALPLSGCVLAFGTNWILPSGGEVFLRNVLVSGLAVNLVLGLILGRMGGGAGMAWAILLTQCLIAGALVGRTPVKDVIATALRSRS